MNNITINSNSNDIKEMEKLFPRAPLKIIAMEGCKELGQKVNDYIVNFRQSSYREELKSPMFSLAGRLWSGRKILERCCRLVQQALGFL